MEILINKETDNLLKDTDAFLMLFKIAYNTRRDDNFTIPDVEIGEAYITADVIGMRKTFRRIGDIVRNAPKNSVLTMKNKNLGIIFPRLKKKELKS